MAAEIETLKEKVAELESKNSTIVQVADRIQGAKDKMETMKKSLLEKEKEVSQLEYMLNAYRSGFRIAPKIKNGEPLGNFTLIDGRSYENALFAGVDRGAIKLATKAGIVNVPLEQIPSQYAQYFNLPGSIPVVNGSLDALAASRPLLEPEKKVAALSPKEKERMERDQERAERAEEKENEAQKMVREQEERTKRNNLRLAKVEELKAQSKNLLLEIVKLKRERRIVENSMKSKKIKMDPNKIASEIGFFDKKIEQLSQQEREIKAAAVKLRMELE